MGGLPRHWSRGSTFHRVIMTLSSTCSPRSGRGQFDGMEDWRTGVGIIMKETSMARYEATEEEEGYERMKKRRRKARGAAEQ